MRPKDPEPPPETAVAESATDAASIPEPPAPPETASAPEPSIPAIAIDAAPSRGTITYDLLYGGGSVGRSVQTWRIDASSYRLASLSEPTGLVALFLPYQYAYASEGKVGPTGLQPETFTARSGRGGSRQSSAKLDWTARQITLGSAGSPRTEPLTPGTQDLLSFVYQIGLGPIEPGRRRMTITSGTKVDTYELDIGPESAIDLPAGPVRAVPIRRIVAPGEEGMEVWLAASPPRLPVRIRFFDRAGRMTIEQLATRIEFDGN